MYLVKLYMKVLKIYTKNQYRPEASIMERYVAEEAIEFCYEYIETATHVDLPESRHESTRQGRCRNLPFVKRATRDSRVHLPRKEYARSRHQHLFEENVGKTRKDMVYKL